MVSFDFNKPPEEAIEYLQNKGFKLTFNHDEMKREAHHKAFTVAKVTRLDLLNDIFTEINDSVKTGKSFKNFKEDLVPKLQKKGWWGEKDIVNPKTGEVKIIKIDSRRLNTIYSTNMRVAYQVARHKAMMELPNSVYWRYISMLLSTSRDEHVNLHGLIKHKNDIWWNTNYPPNDWNCKCKIRAYSAKEIERRGWKINEGKLDNIAHEDWAYSVGKTDPLGSLQKLDLNKSLESLPKVEKNKTFETMADKELFKSFYTALGIKAGDQFIDKVNDPMNIDENLFLDAKGNIKIKKYDRHLFFEEFPKVIADPDEIFLEFDKKAQRLVKKMFRYFTVDGKKRALTAIFEYQKDKTQGVTLYYIDSDKSVESRRKDKLIWKRD